MRAQGELEAAAERERGDGGDGGDGEGGERGECAAEICEEFCRSVGFNCSMLVGYVLRRR